MPPDTVAALLREGRRLLTEAGSETPALDARLLLQEAARLTHEDIATYPDKTVSPDAAERFASLIQRRQELEPVSRIVGRREFYGRPFKVTPDVLDPRPDTETLINAALTRLPRGARILDLGTGSGAIIVTLLAEANTATGLATDISAGALAVAFDNAACLGVENRLSFALGAWFAPVTGRFDLIVSNPPYIPAADIPGLQADVRNFDPLVALDGSADGLAAYRAIALEAEDHLAANGVVIVEIGAGQAGDVVTIFEQSGFRCEAKEQDLGGVDRCLVFSTAGHAACGHAQN
ncbi:MAG: peptide chain release factor N(5)-glutamine methyltransferase [Alphaproteobacteria bacterium]|nr:peptide chain release factor N(5)-glutamine methyltransferase [Alphaproteobacteria bacterium]